MSLFPSRHGVSAVLFVASLCVGSVHAQDMPGMPAAGQQPPALPAPLGISMARMGSGTTWIPEAAPLPSVHWMAGSWELMLHGFLFLQYNSQGGPRGAEQFGSLNWGMLMASRPMAGGRLELRTMLSLDPATVTAKGYPLLLQTGESYKGEPLFDVQHPHDFLMEVAALYEREITPRLGLSLYAAPSGEPALNPVAFMHRPSAMDDPVAPLGHHWTDATHITFGVLTAGLFTRHVKLEGSVFNGRAPDDRRWNIDRIRLDSYSGRVTVNPGRTFSASLGYGFLKSPEELHPEHSAHRITAGLLHGTALGAAGQWASALVVGANRESEDDRWSRALLLETEAVFDARHSVLARVELVEKSGADLVLPAAGPDAVDQDQIFRVSSASLGYVRDFARPFGASLGVGLRGTVNFVPEELSRFYGSRNPLGGLVFLRLRPARSAAMAGMTHDHSAPGDGIRND